MFVGAYWSKRYESKESAAARLARLFAALSAHESLARWCEKSDQDAPGRPVKLDPTSIAASLKSQRKEESSDAMPELGFSLGLWNGRAASLSALIGAHAPHVQNAVVLSFADDPGLSMEALRSVLEVMIEVFDPDRAVVTSDALLDEKGAADPWEAGHFTYVRGEAIVAR